MLYSVRLTPAVYLCRQDEQQHEHLDLAGPDPAEPGGGGRRAGRVPGQVPADGGEVGQSAQSGHQAEAGLGADQRPLQLGGADDGQLILQTAGQRRDSSRPPNYFIMLFLILSGLKNKENKLINVCRSSII